MTTGSLCFTEILKSWKSCSSNSEASQTADSTSASGVGLPYLASSRGSSEPALTPTRMDTPASLAACAIAFTWSSKRRMLPGLTRTAAHPASMAAKTYFGWKWMSAITGICDLRAMAGSASASSWLGQATRTMSHPVAVSSAICCSVALMSVVGVVVIDCTDTGASPPTSTPPTLIWRDLRRTASGRAGTAGIPRAMLMVGTSRDHSARSPEPDRVEDVSRQREQRQPAEDEQHEIGQRHQLVVVDPARVGTAAPGGPPGADLLEPDDGDVPAVEGKQREEVEDADEDVQPAQQRQEDDRQAQCCRLAADPAGAHDADRCLRV